MSEDLKELCTCGHPKVKHGDWIGNCFARDGAYAQCECEQFTSVKPESTGECKP
jgi:hypothetical protein